MSKTIDKIQKLIRLATNNPNDEEAKLAALKACTILHENPVQLSLNREPYREPIRPRYKPPEPRYKPPKKKPKRHFVKEIILEIDANCFRCHQEMEKKASAIWREGSTEIYHTSCWDKERKEHEKAYP